MNDKYKWEFYHKTRWKNNQSNTYYSFTIYDIKNEKPIADKKLSKNFESIFSGIKWAKKKIEELILSDERAEQAAKERAEADAKAEKQKAALSIDVTNNTVAV